MFRWVEAIAGILVGLCIGSATLPNDLVNIRAAMASCESRAVTCEVTITVTPVEVSK